MSIIFFMIIKDTNNIILYVERKNDHILKNISVQYDQNIINAIWAK